MALSNVLPCPLCHNNTEIRAEEKLLAQSPLQNFWLKKNIWIVVSKTNSSTEIGKKLTLEMDEEALLKEYSASICKMKTVLWIQGADYGTTM